MEQEKHNIEDSEFYKSVYKFCCEFDTIKQYEILVHILTIVANNLNNDIFIDTFDVLSGAQCFMLSDDGSFAACDLMITRQKEKRLCADSSCNTNNIKDYKYCEYETIMYAAYISGTISSGDNEVSIDDFKTHVWNKLDDKTKSVLLLAGFNDYLRL